MKWGYLLINFRREGPWDEAHHRLNAGVVEDHVNDAYYKRWLSCNEFFLVGVVLSHNERFSFGIFSDAQSTQRCTTQFAVPRYWTSGVVKTTFFYSGDVASTNPIRWNVILNCHPVGNALTPAVELNSSIDLAGPTGVEVLCTGTFTSYLTVNPGDALFGIRVLREGAHANDTYAGNGYFYGALVEFLPAIRTT